MRSGTPSEVYHAPPNSDGKAGAAPGPVPAAGSAPRSACPVCGGHLIEIRGKLQCERCHTIIETCCEGGPP